MRVGKKGRRIVLAAIAPILAAGMAQADLQWDPANSPLTPSGGVGTWDLSTANWSNGTNDLAWDGKRILALLPAEPAEQRAQHGQVVFLRNFTDGLSERTSKRN